jgi:hypothetical protein
MDQIAYQKLGRWKYRLAEDYRVSIGFFETKAERGNEYVWLDHGWLTVSKGYAWDGPSGLTFDTKNWMRASLVHDALYQLIREGHLPRDPPIRKSVDQLMRAHLLEDGMWRIRAAWSYAAVRRFGHASTVLKPGRKVLKAP